MALIRNPDNRANQDQASKGHLQPHLRRRPALANQEINGLVQALAHQRRKLRHLRGLGLLLELVKASMAARTLVQVTGDTRRQMPALAGFQQV